MQVFLSEPLDGLQRWQMFMIIVTLVCSHLLVNIWMFYAKAARFFCPTRCLLRFLTRTILLSVFCIARSTAGATRRRTLCSFPPQ